jgi:hypothetical protein
MAKGLISSSLGNRQICSYELHFALWKLLKYNFTLEPPRFYYTDRKPLVRPFQWYQSKTISEHKYVSCDAQLCPVIAKGQRAPNAQLAHQIVDRHHEELKSSGPDSQTLKNLFQ